jgi:hypothetical protein
MGRIRDVRHRFHEQRCGLLCKKQVKCPPCGCDPVSLSTGRPFGNDFLGLLHQPVFAKLGIMFVRFASAILESLGFPVYVYKWVCVSLIFHGVHPDRILRLVTRERPVQSGPRVSGHPSPIRSISSYDARCGALEAF